MQRSLCTYLLLDKVTVSRKRKNFCLFEFWILSPQLLVAVSFLSPHLVVLDHEIITSSPFLSQKSLPIDLPAEFTCLSRKEQGH